MKVIGVKTEKYNVEVEINPHNILREIEKKWRKSRGIGISWEVGEKDVWEQVEENYAGIPILTRHRKASGEEIEIDKAFSLISEVIFADQGEEKH